MTAMWQEGSELKNKVRPEQWSQIHTHSLVSEGGEAGVSSGPPGSAFLKPCLIHAHYYRNSSPNCQPPAKEIWVQWMRTQVVALGSLSSGSSPGNNASSLARCHSLERGPLRLLLTVPRGGAGYLFLLYL